MSDTSASLARKIRSAQDLQSVVRTMKALAVSSVGQYEDAVRALVEYHQAVELGLALCFRQLAHTGAPGPKVAAPHTSPRCAIVFGSDQGLVGPFNERIADYASARLLADVPLAPADASPLALWTVGERVRARLEDAGLPVRAGFSVPSSVKAIAPLVGQLQLEVDAARDERSEGSVLVFYQRPVAAGLYEATHQRLLPLDATWRADVARVPWPTKRVPELLGRGRDTLRTLLGEYLFISLYRACAESLASENRSRLVAMERADRNIDELLETMSASFHRLRQASIDEELFDVIAGYEALGGTGAGRARSG